MERYAYLSMSCYFLLIAGWIYLRRSDQRRIIIRAGIFGAGAGPLAEIWFFSDYWRPLSIVGRGRICPEDVLVGIGVSATASVIYKFLWKKTDTKNYSPLRKKIFLLFFCAGVLILVFLSTILKFNSGLVAASLFLIFGIAMVVIQPDLLKPAIMSATVLAALAYGFYAVIFNLLIPSFIPNAFFGIAETRLPGGMPATELHWYFSWGLLAGVAHEFIGGRSLVDYDRPAKNRRLTTKRAFLPRGKINPLLDAPQRAARSVRDAQAGGSSPPTPDRP
jgi:hypothetical protein